MSKYIQLRNPKYGTEVILCGNRESGTILIRAAAILAVQGIMARAVIPAIENDAEVFTEEVVFPVELHRHTIVLGNDFENLLSFDDFHIFNLCSWEDISQGAMRLASFARSLARD